MLLTLDNSLVRKGVQLKISIFIDIDRSTHSTQTGTYTHTSTHIRILRGISVIRIIWINIFEALTALDRRYATQVGQSVPYPKLMYTICSKNIDLRVRNDFKYNGGPSTKCGLVLHIIIQGQHEITIDHEWEYERPIFFTCEMWDHV